LIAPGGRSEHGQNLWNGKFQKKQEKHKTERQGGGEILDPGDVRPTVTTEPRRERFSKPYTSGEEEVTRDDSGSSAVDTSALQQPGYKRNYEEKGAKR